MLPYLKSLDSSACTRRTARPTLANMRWVPLLFITASLFAADADSDWQGLTALDAGPGKAPETPQDALQISLAHLDTQEKAYRAFLAEHPNDPRTFNARLRLARLLG